MSKISMLAIMLNINEELIQDLQEVVHEDNSLTIKIKLKVLNPNCPYCKRKAKIHGYIPRKLNHATLVNRKCTLFYQQRRFKCDNCELTFHEPNPFSMANDNVTYETILNPLKDLKHPEFTYTAVADRYNVAKSTVTRLFDKYVKIPRKKLTRVI